MKLLEKFSNEAYALMRIVTGAMFSFHGMQKILGIMSANPRPEVGSQMWIGGLIELVGGLMVAAGLGTRYAAFICSGQMAVAYFQFHWKFQMGEAFFPAINQGELAALYCFVFLVIACKGAVKWGVQK